MSTLGDPLIGILTTKMIMMTTIYGLIHYRTRKKLRKESFLILVTVGIYFPMISNMHKRSVLFWLLIWVRRRCILRECIVSWRGILSILWSVLSLQQKGIQITSFISHCAVIISQYLHRWMPIGWMKSMQWKLSSQMWRHVTVLPVTRFIVEINILHSCIWYEDRERHAWHIDVFYPYL